MWRSESVAATLKAIAGDLGVSRGALKEWAGKLGAGSTTDGPTPPVAGARPESQARQIVRVEAELATSKTERTKLETERQVAKYFAGETN